jgi:hypothetical protein
MTRTLLGIWLALSVGCGAAGPSAPSTSATTGTVSPASATCSAIAFIRIEGQTVTIGLTQPATVTVSRTQGSRLELEPSVVRQSATEYRGDVHFDNDYVATATCQNGATDTKPFHVGPENHCGGCTDAPTARIAICSLEALDVRWSQAGEAMTATVTVRAGWSGQVGGLSLRSLGASTGEPWTVVHDGAVEGQFFSAPGAMSIHVTRGFGHTAALVEAVCANGSVLSSEKGSL